jgi:hypothetical protein
MANPLVLSVLLAALGPDLGDGTAVARQIATEYAAQTRGIETFIVTTQTDIRGGPVHRTELSETMYIDLNGTPTVKRVRKDVKNGKPAGAEDLVRLSKSEEGPISRFGMKAPYGAPALTDYAFAPPRESGDLVLLDFTPTIVDTAHGGGTIAYSRRAGRIDRVIYKPVVLPKEPGSVVITSTTIEITFGPVAGERWDVVKIVRTFTGREGPIGGRGVVTSLYENYRVHSTEAAAIVALDEPSS